MLGEFPIAAAAGKVTESWRPSAESLYRNWLTLIAARKDAIVVRGLTLTCAVAALLSGCSPARTRAVSWNRRRGRAYLEARAGWWLRWPSATRDHGTVCVSCHTTLPVRAVADRDRRAGGTELCRISSAESSTTCENGSGYGMTWNRLDGMSSDYGRAARISRHRSDVERVDPRP